MTPANHHTLRSQHDAARLTRAWRPGPHLSLPGLASIVRKKLAGSHPSDPPTTSVLKLDQDLKALRHATTLRKLLRASAHEGCIRIVLDIADATHADSSTVAALVLARRIAHRNGLTLEIRCSQQMRDWIHIYRLEWLLDADADPDELEAYTA